MVIAFEGDRTRRDEITACAHIVIEYFRKTGFEFYKGAQTPASFEDIPALSVVLIT
jgi:hypothetical protein